MSDRLTLATAAGLPLITLVFHVAMGMVALIAGTVAIIAKKGGLWHRRGGRVFVLTMLAMALTAVGIGVLEGESDVGAGALTAYLVFTAWTTVRPLPDRTAARRVDIALMLFAFFLAVVGYLRAYAVFGMPGRQSEGVPVGMMLFMTTIVILAAIGDARMIRAGGIGGRRRLARHLWRMCYGLFVATGSFIAQLVMMTFMPAWMRSVPVILVLAAGPLVVLVYWMWRVRSAHAPLLGVHHAGR